MSRIAQCACGAASVSVNGEPRLHAVCHCTNCKRRTGSAFGVSAYFRRADVAEIRGKISVYAFHHPDNYDEERHFCSTCGTTLCWYSSVRPHLVGIAAGCFPDDSFGVPTISATSSKKLPWVELASSCRLVER